MMETYLAVAVVAVMGCLALALTCFVSAWSLMVGGGSA